MNFCEAKTPNGQSCAARRFVFILFQIEINVDFACGLQIIWIKYR